MRKVGVFTVQPDPAGIMGVSFWAYYFPTAPKFEVFEYIGKDPIHDMFFFESRRNGQIFMRHGKNLVSTEFKPFLLNFDRVDQAMKVAIEPKKEEEKN